MNVFKKIVFCTLLVGISFICSAQEISIRGGLNISQMHERIAGRDVAKDATLKPGFHLGPTFSFNLIKPLALETGIFYSSKGLRNKGKNGFDETTYLEKLNLSYLEVPLNIKVKIFERNLSLYGYCGGYFGYALWGSLYSNPDTSKDEDFYTRVNWKRGMDFAIKRMDFGADIGFEVKTTKSAIGVNFLLGLKGLSYVHNSWVNRTLEIYLKRQLWYNNKD